MASPKTATVEVRGELGWQGWSGSGQRMPRSHRHNDLEINLVTRGEFVYLFGGKRVRIGAGHIGLFWATMPHQLIELDRHTQAHWLTFPLAWFLQCGFGVPLTRPLLEGVPLVTQARSTDVDLLQQWQADLASDSATQAARRCVALELEARLRRWEAQIALKPIPPSPPSTLYSGQNAELMAQWIAQHFTEAITVAQVAAAAKLHPNYAMNLFRRSFGVSIIDYITQHRIALAQQLLVTTDDGILHIALQSGFGSSSQFYAAFKHWCGRTPRAYRASLQ